MVDTKECGSILVDEKEGQSHDHVSTHSQMDKLQLKYQITTTTYELGKAMVGER